MLCIKPALPFLANQPQLALDRGDRTAELLGNLFIGAAFHLVKGNRLLALVKLAKQRPAVVSDLGNERWLRLVAGDQVRQYQGLFSLGRQSRRLVQSLRVAQPSPGGQAGQSSPPQPSPVSSPLSTPSVQEGAWQRLRSQTPSTHHIPEWS